MMIQIFGIAVALIPYISYMPQIIKILKTKSSEDISVTSWILYVTGSTLASIYAILLNNALLILADVSELVLCLVTLLLSIRYKDRKDKYDYSKSNKVN